MARLRVIFSLALVGVGIAVVIGAAPALQIEEAEAGGSFTVDFFGDVTAGDGVCLESIAFDLGLGGTSVALGGPIDSPCALRSAIEAANASPGSAVITLLVGTYQISEGELVIEDEGGKVTIEGAGAGMTVIDAGGSSRVFRVEDGGELELSGVTIRNGDTGTTNDMGVTSGGGAILTGVGSTLVVSDSVIEMSLADGGGGLSNAGAATLTRTVVRDNTAADAGAGGGIVTGTGGSSLTLVESVVRDNVSMGSGGELGGGGIQVQSGSVLIVDSTISGNTTNGFGGGVVAFTGSGQPTPTVSIVDSTVYDNRATGALGGGVHAGVAVVSLTNVTISGNASDVGGGGVSLGLGGAMVSITNTTIAGNSSPPGTGAGVHQGSGQATLQNTIVASNLPSDCAGGVSSSGYNLDSDDTCNLTGMGDLPGSSAMLGPLGDNGGPTETHALLSGSAAINGGDDGSAPALDQRGELRNGTSDIGAYELQGPFGVDGDGDGFDSMSTGGTDCDDTDDSVFPGADEVAGDGIDQDCDGEDLKKEAEEEGEPPEEMEEAQEPPEEMEEMAEPPSPGGELVVMPGGQFVFWQLGPVLAAEVFAGLRIAWLFNATAFSWTSFVPPLGTVNFPVADGAVLWLVADIVTMITVGG